MSERAALTKTSENKGKNPVGAKPKENFYESMDSPVEQIFHLQQTIGNQAVQRLLKSGTIQAKLKIGQPNDKYEQEADRIADRVMSMPETKGALADGHSSSVQRQSTCPECPEKEGIQTKPLAEQITPLVQRQADEEEKSVQTKLLQRQETEEEPVQTKRIQRQEAEEEEEAVQTKLQRQPEEEEEEPVQTKLLQRQETGEEEEEPVQAKQANNQASTVTSNIESSINSLKGGGQPLPESTRSYFEPRFGADFSQVRVHTDSKAGEASKSVNANAFTTGRNVVFSSGQYSPGTPSGKKLIAHELTHVVQQRSNILSRKKATKAKKAETKAQVGPVSGEGGLINDTYQKRLSFIIGPNDTLRSIAKKLLPIWNSAKPFKLTSTSAPIPFTPLTIEQLAKGLLVYNRYYLAVPFMTKWKVGLRFPLPIRINKLTGERILHPGLIATWAKNFNSKWVLLLDRKPVSTKMPGSAELEKSVKNFLTAQTTLTGRGIALSAKAMTNSLEAEPFIKEVFKQVGKDAFAVALEFMNWLVNHQLQLLASQRPGFEIILAVRKILSKPPASLGSEQKKSLTRAQLMLSKIDVSKLRGQEKEKAKKKVKMLRSDTASGKDPNKAERDQIEKDTGVTLDANPYIGISDIDIEAVCNASASGLQPPWVLLAIWAKEGSTRTRTGGIPVNASSEKNARALARSFIYYVDLGADHFIHYTAVKGKDNKASFKDKDAPAHDKAFKSAIKGLVNKKYLESDPSGRINNELKLEKNADGSYSVSPTAKFYAESLRLVDAFFSSLQYEKKYKRFGGVTSSAMTYMNWNLRSFEDFLESAEKHRKEPEYRKGNSEVPTLEEWALEKKPKKKEWKKARVNAIRFKFYLIAYKKIFEAGIL